MVDHPSPSPPLPFSDVTALTPTAPGQFAAHVSEEWTIGGKLNGGYLLSMLGRAAASMTPHEHPVAASAHYLRSPVAGPVVIEAEVLRTGRSASHVRSRMGQNGRACVEATMTLGQLDPSTTPYWDGGLPDMSHVPFDDCPRVIPRVPSGVRVALSEQVEVRLEPGSSGFTEGRPSGRGELRGWLSLPGAATFDPLALLFAVDAFPPATFDIDFAGWVPTFELTVYVRALPEPGPVRVLQRAQLVEAQMVDETCFVWDQRGRLVAQGTQLAGVRLGQ